MRGDSVPAQPPPCHASFCFPQEPQRLPQAAAKVTLVTIMPLHGDRLVPRKDTSQSPTGLGRQEARLEDGHSLPHCGTVTRPQRLSVSDLPPLHGPPLTVTPPCRLRPGTERAASARVKLPPLPAAPAASASSLTRRARSAGPVTNSYRELVPPSPWWESLAADRAQVTPSPDNSAERLLRGAAARQGYYLKPLRAACGLPLRTGPHCAWNYLGPSEMEQRTEAQEEESVNSYGEHFGDRDLCLCEERSTKSTCIQERSSLWQGANVEPQVLPSTPGLTEGEMGNSSELLSPGMIAEPCSASDNPECWDTPPKEPEWEEEELPETEAAGDRDSDSKGASFPAVKEEKAEAAASALDKDPYDEGHKELYAMSEPEQCSDISASPSFGSPSEESGAHQLPEQTPWGKLMSTGPEDASKHLLNIEAEELEKLEEDILSSMDLESSRNTTYTLWDPSSLTLGPVAGPSVPHSLCSWTKGCAGETEHHAQLVPPVGSEEQRALFNNKDAPSRDAQSNQSLAVLEEEELQVRDTAGDGESKTESTFSLTMEDKEAVPPASPLDMDPCDEWHSEPLPTALPNDPGMFVDSVLLADPTDEADAAWMQAGCAQASLPQEEPCRAGVPAGVCPVPAQALAYIVPAGPAGSAAVPLAPAPRPWSSMAKRARRALRRLFSFSCLRGRPEE
ncbi:hypothetical protein TURU_068398 [Turdus rufiventris]|nr:hypothetical protein TURU_068398 [Turdus rufiventris]